MRKFYDVMTHNYYSRYSHFIIVLCMIMFREKLRYIAMIAIFPYTFRKTRDVTTILIRGSSTCGENVRKLIANRNE